MYTYYSKHESDEHMLYADEIAEALGLYTEKYKLHDKFVHAYINDFIDKNINNYDQLYYLNRYGSLKKVYPQSFIVIFKDLIKNYTNDQSIIQNIRIDDKNYKIRIKGGR